MGSASVTAAVGISMDFHFRVFFGRAITFDAGPVAFGADLVALMGPNVGPMKLSARGTASL